MSASVNGVPHVEGVAIRAHKLFKGPLPYIHAVLKAMTDLW